MDLLQPIGLSRSGRSDPKARILLVDDNPTNLLSLRALLDELDQTLVEARSGDEAIQRVQADDYAVILLDVLMPGLSGFETAKAIRSQERSRHTPIIFLTASDIDRSQQEQAYRLGAVDFLEKPLLPVAVRAKARGFVELFLEKQRAKLEAEQLQLLVHGTVDYAIFMLDPQGYIITWNAGAERVKGYKAEDIIGQHFARFYSQEAIDRGWPDHELKVATAEGRFEDEGWRVRKDGTQFWANVIITVLKDERGNLLGFSKITRDLTERKAAEENARRLVAEAAARRVAEENGRLIQEQRERLHVTLSSIGDAVISTDAEGRVEFINPVAQELIGWGNDEAFRRTLTEVFNIVDEETRQPVENPAMRALKEDVVVGLANHTVLISRDGRERPIDDSAAPIKDSQGHVMGSVLVFRDITERRRNEERLREQREWLRVTLASIGDAVIASDTEGRVTFLNSVAEHLTGWTQTEAQGRPLRTVFHIINEQTRKPVENPVAKVLRDGAIVGLGNHTVLVAKDGTERPIDDSAAPIQDAAGKLIGVVLTFRDVTENRQAEAALRRSEAETRRLLEFHEAVMANMGEGLYAVDSQGRVTYMNRAAEAYFGWKSAELLGRKMHDMTHYRYPDGRPFPIEECAGFRVLKEEKVLRDYDDVFIRKDGTFFPVVYSSSPLLTEGKVSGLVVVFRDVSERTEIEAALRQSEQRFRQLADAMPQIVWTARPDGKIDYLNRRWTEFTGLPQTVGNEGWGPLLHPDDATTARQRWAASVGSGDLFEMQLRLLDRGEQAYRWHLVRTVAVKDGEGKVARWFGTATDIQGQKRDEESARYLAEASAALATVVDYQSTLQKVANLAVPHFADWSAVDVANDDGSLRRLAVAHQDADKIDLVHQLMRDYPPDPDAPLGVYAVLRTGKPEFVTQITDEMLVKGAQDERHLGLIRSLGLRSYICVPLVVSGKTLGVLTFATAESGRRYTDADLTVVMDLANRAAVAIENTRLYQALRETDRRKDEFLATLAHELRNPLAPIRNSLQILRMPRVDAETVERSRDMMERQVHHLVRLVDDLLDVSRVMRGKIELRKERIELATVVARAVETVQPLVESQTHQLSVRLPNDSLPLDADPVRLTQVVGNLLTNAAKYTEPGGQIWLTAERDGDMAILRVRDTGLGIAPHMLPRIFELFVQVDQAAARSQGGLGIGLTLVKNLVDMHNGTVEADSDGLGRGSEFTVRLPLSRQKLAEREDQETAQPREMPPPSGLRLLVVDDNQDAANSLAMLLRLQGHEVRAAYSGVAALEMTKTYIPDMIFLDIGMPGMDGYETARRLRQQPGLKKVNLTALTGWGQREDRRRSAEAGFDHHIVKPPKQKLLESLILDIKSRKS